MRYSALVAVVVLLAGCGGASNRQAAPRAPTSPPASQPSPPGTPKPTLAGVSSSPPAAWLETERGSFWLGYSSYCWGTVCADVVAPSCDNTEHTPKITLRRGEVVTAHLDFDPTELGLSFLSEKPFPTVQEQKRLEPSRSPSWRAKRAGPISLFARVKGGDASYAACVEFK